MFNLYMPYFLCRQGIVVLSRQWKNVIYTPILIEYNLKTSGMKNLYQHDMGVEGVSEDGQEDTSDEEEGFSDLEMDEETSLLKNTFAKAKYFQEGSIISNLSYFKSKGLRSGCRSPNSDDILALIENGEKDRKSTILGGSIYSDDSAAVRSAKSEKMLSAGPSSPVTKSKMGKPLPDAEDEDLYHWMKRQQNNQEGGGEAGNVADKPSDDHHVQEGLYILYLTFLHIGKKIRRRKK